MRVQRASALVNRRLRAWQEHFAVDQPDPVGPPKETSPDLAALMGIMGTMPAAR